MNDPIDKIEWRDASELIANHWNPNRVHKKEFDLLEKSILRTGWIQPILINPSGLIIDGFHRWRLSLDSAALKERYNGKVPVAVVDVPDDQAMVTTVRINRAKGTHIAVEMHNLVTCLVTEYGWTIKGLAQELGATTHEIQTLMQEGVFAAKNIENWKYSQAWYPAEGPFGGEKGTEWARERGLSL